MLILDTIFTHFLTHQLVSTDSRKIDPDCIFFALKGDNFNGNEYAQSALESGAAYAIMDEDLGLDPNKVLIVDKVLTCLQKFAHRYRQEFDIPVIAITGSNGKTSTKDFLKAVLASAGEVNATKGNLNNHIGLPMTVLDTENHHQFGIWEMGMNHPGEIGPLAEIASPDCAVVTNIGTAHIEHMKTREAIANEKAALPRSVLKDGFCVMPATDDYFQQVSDQIYCKMIKTHHKLFI